MILQSYWECGNVSQCRVGWTKLQVTIDQWMRWRQSTEQLITKDNLKGHRVEVFGPLMCEVEVSFSLSILAMSKSNGSFALNFVLNSYCDLHLFLIWLICLHNCLCMINDKRFKWIWLIQSLYDNIKVWVCLLNWFAMTLTCINYDVIEFDQSTALIEICKL